MLTLKERIADIASYLQSLMSPDIFPKVKDAVEKKDKELIVQECRKAKIPEIYLSTIAAVLLSVSPEQKWPAMI
jgi:hypothetical protein